MTMIPAQEAAYRRKIRRCLTLDLFTRSGGFWGQIDDIREQWRVDVIVSVPPEPTSTAESVGVFDYETMPERFHMPSKSYLPVSTLTGLEHVYDEVEDATEAERATLLEAIQALPSTEGDTRIFLKEIEGLWTEHIAPPDKYDDVRNGANAAGWMTWAPFLSACVMYDPPRDQLLEFADHDDHVTAELKQRTFSTDSRLRKAAETATRLAWKARDGEMLEDAVSLFEVSHTESDAPAKGRGRGNQSDPLRDVQCAVLALDDNTPQQIGARLGMNEYVYEDSYETLRSRPNAVEKAIKRGNEILAERAKLRQEAERQMLEERRLGRGVWTRRRRERAILRAAIRKARKLRLESD